MNSTIEDTRTEELEQVLSAAATAADPWAATPARNRAAALRAIADHLDGAADTLVDLGTKETFLPEARLRGELKRTTFQLRLFAEVLDDGSYQDIRIDTADEQWPMGAPRPDLRRVLEPVGPVLVFAASNFPFAFSGAGGDTAAALAAGCPVILKAHPGHPELSVATADVIQAALRDADAPTGLYSVIFGLDAGRTALVDPRVQAGSFTGSIAAGRALFDLANARETPIPFFAEMGSVNPTFVTRAAAHARGADIASAFFASMTASSGQLCTKPGVLVVPEDMLVHLRSQTPPPPSPLLNEGIQEGYVRSLQELVSHPGVAPLLGSEKAFSDPPEATLLVTSIGDVLGDPSGLLAERFGPAALVVTYQDEGDLVRLARVLEGQLTASIHGEDDDDVQDLIRELAKRAGRLLWNQWPTGVSVTYAQHHGGPYPATTQAGTTSVGTAAILRFLRPVAYQGFPQSRLPGVLRDDAPTPVQRMLNGKLVSA
ncbi:aldehyde dehydrogenase (NADP(+)) [Arthrobacter sp. NamB2]|uniref:aldehyde dehydrogenase (NADP(+)) n=1 Tax=Arthrobacter sp. NamB2 TaxID=2576035 RepID=UPI00167873EB|nr:aldehyde dehydrogenase (NADP(+)) [Arthrobacter sp. NamB2]